MIHVPCYMTEYNNSKYTQFQPSTCSWLSVESPFSRFLKIPIFWLISLKSTLFLFNIDNKITGNFQNWLFSISFFCFQLFWKLPVILLSILKRNYVLFKEINQKIGIFKNLENGLPTLSQLHVEGWNCVYFELLYSVM